MKKKFLILFAFISVLALSQVPQRFNKVIVTGDITSPKFIKTGSTVDSVLLGNGSARAINTIKIDTTSLSNRINTKQEILVSGTNIRTVNGNSLVGSGDISIISGGGGAPVNIYLSNVDSSISGYKNASPVIDVTESVKTITATTANVITWGEKYLYQSPVATTIIPSGFWELHAYGHISTSTGVSKLVFRVLRYSGSTETILATFTGFEVNNTTDADLFVNGSTNDITVLAGDYLGIQVGFLSDGTSPARTLTYTIGDGNASHFNTPLPTRHSALRDKNGEVDFQHLTAAQVTKVNNTSGINTGDETLTSIKTKLGAATSANDGYLKYTDFTNFNTKQNQLNGTGFIKASGTTISYDNSSYLTSFTELDPSVYSWAKSATKPSYTYSEVGAAPSSTVSNANHTGDVTGSTALTLATVNSNIGTFNNVTINAKGLATVGSNVSYLTGITSGQVTTALGYTPLPTRTFGSAANNNTADFYASGSTVVNSNQWGGWLSALDGGPYDSAPTTLLGYYNDGSKNIQRFTPTSIKNWLGLNSISTQSTGGLNTNYILKWNNGSFTNSLVGESVDGIFIASTTIPDLTLWGSSVKDPAMYFGRYKSSGLSNGCKIQYDFINANTQESGGISIWTNPNASGTNTLTKRFSIGSDGVVSVLSTAQSSSPTTGSFIVGGGIGAREITNTNYLSTYYSGSPLLMLGSDASIYGGTGTNVGLYVYGNNQLDFSTNSFKRLSIYGGGNVGIGYTTDQGYKLSVNGTGLFSGKVRVNDATESDLSGATPVDGSITTIGGITAAKDIQTGGDFFSNGSMISHTDVSAGGTVYSTSGFVKSGGTSSQLLAADGSTVNVNSIASTGGSYSPSISVGSNTANPVVYSALYTKNGTVYSSVIKGYIECTGSQGNTCTFNVSTYNGSTANLSIIGVGAQGTNMILGSGSTGSNVVVSFTNPVGSGGIGFTLIVHYTN